jgi:hypothetical protein
VYIVDHPMLAAIDRLDAVAHVAHLARIAVKTVAEDLRSDLADFLIARASPWLTRPRGKREERRERPDRGATVASAWVWQRARVRISIGIEVAS